MGADSREIGRRKKPSARSAAGVFWRVSCFEGWVGALGRGEAGGIGARTRWGVGLASWSCAGGGGEVPVPLPGHFGTLAVDRRPRSGTRLASGNGLVPRWPGVWCVGCGETDGVSWELIWFAGRLRSPGTDSNRPATVLNTRPHWIHDIRREGPAAPGAYPECRQSA